MREHPATKYDFLEIWVALEELVKLQSHYARILNQYDGGNRLEFQSANEWMDRQKRMNRRHDDNKSPK